jgi:hypothetical protein
MGLERFVTDKMTSPHPVEYPSPCGRDSLTQRGHDPDLTHLQFQTLIGGGNLLKSTTAGFNAAWAIVNPPFDRGR